MSYKSVPQECPTRVPYKSVPQECPTRVSHKSVLQESPTRVSCKSVPYECPTRVSYKSVPQEFPTRVSHKSVLQECPTRVSYKSVPQECPTRVSRKSVPQEFPTRVTHKSVLQECHLDICSFLNVFAFGFVGSILCFFPECVAKGSRLTLGGLGVESCSRLVASMFATVRNRSQPFATVRSRSLRRCHWGKLLQVTIHGCVTCQFATLVHCDLRENDMSRKKRDAFRCTGAAFCEICRLLRSSIGISVWRVVFLGVGCGRAIGICVSGCGIEALFS